MEKKEALISVMGALVFLAILIGAMSLAADDDAQAKQHYCAMISDGYWPAYDSSINCGGE